MLKYAKYRFQLEKDALLITKYYRGLQEPLDQM